MYALMNDPAAAPVYATAARRRAVVAAHVLLTAVTAAAWLGVVYDVFLGASLAVMCVGMVGWVFLTGALNSATRGLLELRSRILDERQLAERDAVRARAHQLTTWLLAGAAGGVGSVALFAGLRVESLVFPVLFAVLVTHWVMPLWVGGLRVQDEPEED
ncbi:hypothetical protein GCM10014713_60590 [Streptomyces purpureus]|uniref:Uncharacterized protein n=2 Tax=Streptomyces purpureus TaxID=1951 RepID=A0A918HFA0_9ACTN|nr:hypothetical protein GCM10014713_60590 [Streptomyces purpureus]